MTTTTGDPSTLKTPASLSGGDLVSRLLAATPPYLYNVPLTPHSFFFSEMLRSFVQAKAEAFSTGNSSVASRRRKRSWRDARDRPLELTTKERTHEKYFHTHQDSQVDNRTRHCNDQSYNTEIGQSHGLNLEQKSNFNSDVSKLDDNKSDFAGKQKNYFDDRHRHFGSEQASLFPPELPKVKPEELQQNERKTCTFGERNAFEDRAKSNGELSFLPDQKNKLDFSSRSFLSNVPAGRGEDLQQSVKNFGLPSNSVPNSEFLPSPLWYPPYPMPQSYPGIDPLHFFIDLRVSGHIWDRKVTERQLPFKNKHSSAFSVPQSKEFNRPLNLTRDEATVSKIKEENFKGTHYILKNLIRTYKDIRAAEKNSARVETSVTEIEGSQELVTVVGDLSKKEETSSSQSQDEERKDLRALIGLELVVDYVKEPKGDPVPEKSSNVTE